MKQEQLRSKIHLYGVHPTAAGLNKIMDAIQKLVALPVKRAGTNCEEILSGPYWERRKQLKE